LPKWKSQEGYTFGLNKTYSKIHHSFHNVSKNIQLKLKQSFLKIILATFQKVQ